ncbi:MAG: diguanylate cyclase [Desulfosalsimonadaceae bacterium]
MKSDELNSLHQLIDNRGYHLRFKKEELEREFQQDYARRYLTHMQIAGFLGLFAFLSCGVLDLIFMPTMSDRTWFARMVVGAPMLALLLSLGRSMGDRHMQPIFTIFSCVFAGGLVAISLNSIEPYSYFYYNSVTVMMVIVFAVSRIQLKWGIIVAIIISLTQNLAMIGFGLMSNKLAIIAISNYVFFVSAVSALIGTFMVERSLRQNYLQSRMLSIKNRDLEEFNLNLQYMVAVDGLTQIANRSTLDRTLTIEWQRARRKREPIGFIMMDIDHFKLFNDTYGHQAGDECLRVVAATLKDCAQRPGDLAARYGGEEFALVLSDTSLEQARIVAERGRQKIMEVAISYKKSAQAHVTASFGVASLAPGSRRHSSPEALILAADRALYRAKRSGRNRVVVDGEPDSA